MKTLKLSKKRNLPLTIFALLLLLAGAYLLLTALNPMIQGVTSNPTDNPTVHKLVSTAENITEDRLYIPDIDVNLPYQTGNESVMENGAWWRKPENGNPKDGGNFVLSAHRFVMGLTPEQTLRKSPFYHINKLALGDELVVDYQGVRYTYVISKIFAVTPDAIEIENRTDAPQLTLYSCTLGGASDGREVIIAKLHRPSNTDSQTLQDS